MVQSSWFRIDGDFINLQLTAIGRKVLIGGLSVTASIILAVIAVKWLKAGVNGMCLGYILGRLVLSVSYPAMVGRLLDVSFAAQAKASIRPMIVNIAVFGGLTFFSMRFTLESWLALAFAGSLSAMLIAIVGFLTGLSAESRREVISRISLLLHAGPK
jgi:hypothetical protein